MTSGIEPGFIELGADGQDAVALQSILDRHRHDHLHAGLSIEHRGPA